MGGRDPTTRATTRCLPEYISAGSQNLKRKKEMNPGILMWDTSVPSDILTAETNALPTLQFYRIGCFRIIEAWYG